MCITFSLGESFSSCRTLQGDLYYILQIGLAALAKSIREPPPPPRFMGACPKTPTSLHQRFALSAFPSCVAVAVRQNCFPCDEGRAVGTYCFRLCPLKSPVGPSGGCATWPSAPPSTAPRARGCSPLPAAPLWLLGSGFVHLALLSATERACRALRLVSLLRWWLGRKCAQ